MFAAAIGRSSSSPTQACSRWDVRNNPGVIPVGESWLRAMQAGVADPNPYDGIEFGKVSLWTHDHYHGSTHGYYLEALMIFGDLTGLDPRSLGKGERAAFELGLSGDQAVALQQVAYDELMEDAAQAIRPVVERVEFKVAAACPRKSTALPGIEEGTAKPKKQLAPALAAFGSVALIHAGGGPDEGAGLERATQARFVHVAGFAFQGEHEQKVRCGAHELR